MSTWRSSVILNANRCDAGPSASVISITHEKGPPKRALCKD